jgi:hypothetical protein
MIEGSGFGSVPLINGLTKAKKNIRIRICNTDFTLLNLYIFLWQEEEEGLVGMEGFQCREEARLNILNAAIRHIVSNTLRTH